MKLLAYFGIAGMALILSGCLNSPLLNHADASTLNAGQNFDSSGCQLELSKEGLCVSLTWVKQPTEDDPGEFTLRFWNASQGTEAGPYVSPSNTVFVKLWMPDMGHGSSPITVIPEKDANGLIIPGVFDATGVYFVMPGMWQILIQLKQGSNIVDQATLDIQV